MKPDRRLAMKHPRRGGVYVVVLSVAMIVTIMGLAGLTAARLHARSVGGVADIMTARVCADAGTEMVAQAVAGEASWRQTRLLGAWFQRRALGSGQVSVVVTDPEDGNLSNRPTDPVEVTSIGRAGDASHLQRVTLDVQGAPIAALGSALHTAGELRLNSGATLLLGGSIASTNGALNNNGTIDGIAQCFVATRAGTVTGGVNILATSKPMPDSGIVALYRALSTEVSTSATIERMVIAPGRTPWAITNQDGLYTVVSSSDITIRDMRLEGTLVIICPGRTVTIESSVFMRPARPDYPVLIVDGNVLIRTSRAVNLSEATLGVNLNPAAAPFDGASDTVADDVYACNIQGLVHVRGTLTTTGTPLITGVVIVESSASNAVLISDSPQISRDQGLYDAPPMGYADSLTLRVRAGSWRQLTWDDVEGDALFDAVRD